MGRQGTEQGRDAHPLATIDLEVNFELRTAKVDIPGFSVKVDGIEVKTGMPLINGAKVGHPIDAEPNVDVNLGIHPQIRFTQGCDAVKGFPVISTLHRLTDTVSDIIESFTLEF